jgi:homoserine/homoserine lactone efflux protein
MTPNTLLAYAAVAALAIVSPGPAVVLALRNALTFGARATVWTAFGNISGVTLLAAASMLGLGVALKTSAMLFLVLKLIGAGYLGYVGLKHLLGRSSIVIERGATAAVRPRHDRGALFREAFLMAVTNPKAILFFTALFPQFMSPAEPLLPQFVVLTGIFATISFCSMMTYAHLAASARDALNRGRFVLWLNRVVGAAFLAFAGMLLTMRRPVVP